MTSIALFGAGGKMGCRLTDNFLKTNYKVHYLEVSPKGIENLKQRGVALSAQAEAVRPFLERGKALGQVPDADPADPSVQGVRAFAITRGRSQATVHLEFESMLQATVAERDAAWHLARVEFPGGSLWVRDGATPWQAFCR